MKCRICGSENTEDAQFCTRCGTTMSVPTVSVPTVSVPTVGGVGRVIKVWLVGGLTGLGTGLSFMLVHNALTTDLVFHLWEFGVASVTPALIAVVVALATKSRIVMLLTVAYLTLLLPVLGASFGASGSEPLWQFAALGLVGGLVWSIPFALWQLRGLTHPAMVSLPAAIALGFKRYFEFSGRSTRAELWWWVLFVVVISILLSIIGGYLLVALFALATLIPSLAVVARRLHDIGKSALWLLLLFALFIGWIVLIVWAIRRGDDGPNKYGADPRQITSQ